MPFVPHTEADVQLMLERIGAPSIDALFDEIPSELRCGRLDGVPERLGEMEISRLMGERAAEDGQLINFCGAGAYEHHIPSAVWEITTRGEFYSAYTPYQAEASQGTLQLLYEYQTMMSELTGMEVSNASLYDGASALAESLLMAARANKANPSMRVLLPQALHPFYREVVHACTHAQGIRCETLPMDAATGQTDLSRLDALAGEAPTAVVVAQPNFFGVMEPVDALTDWAHEHKALVVGLVNPVSLALLKPPGQWGQTGADIVCGEGQPLGAPLSSGGPYFGFLTARQSLVRQVPGRIVGRTIDADGKEGFALTLQAREQHIRRAKATSNICTNQGLLVTAATIHLALLGPEGLAKVASACMSQTRKLVASLCEIDGIEPVFSGHRFHEAALRLPVAPATVIERMAEHNILAGFDLCTHFPELGNALLVCATETRSDDDIKLYRDALASVLDAVR